MGSFFWGYVLLQIPGAVMAKKWGGKRVFGIGVLGTSILTLALPVCAKSLWLLYFVRAFMGVMEAVTYPAQNEMFTHWVPAPERAFGVTFANTGSSVGTALAMPISGVIIGMAHDAGGVSTT